MGWVLFFQILALILVVALFGGAIVSMIVDQRKARTADIRELTEALRITVEYVGTDVLPPAEGWFWFEALQKYDPKAAEIFLLRERMK